ncbi:MAG TPA: Stp1/IreP family PP2C-type Ser/Thr phosphatase [Candidatus Eisenbacteria bacterium]
MQDGRGTPPKQSLRASFEHDGPVTVVVRAATDLGLKRQNNEDSYGCWLPDDPAERERRGLLLAVADGMGGVKGGEVASRITVETVMRAYGESPGTDVAQDLQAALTTANRMVHRESEARPDLNGMGTTCTAAVVRGREMYVAHVGDSRAYLVRSGKAQQLTHDHSLVGQLVRDRQLTVEQARTDPRRNVVTRSVGISEEVDVDAERIAEPMRDGDVLMLCTDGLHGLVRDDELGAAVAGRDLDQACERLVGLAKQRGGPDNITVILARAESPTNGEAVPPSASAERLGRAGSNPTLAMLLVAGLMLLLLALGALGWLVVRMTLQPHTQGVSLSADAGTRTT